MKSILLCICLLVYCTFLFGQENVGGSEKLGQDVNCEQIVKELIDNGTWIIKFDRLTEENDNKLSYRGLDQSCNFMVIEGNKYIFQTMKNGAQIMGSRTKKEILQVNNGSYTHPYPGNNGIGGFTSKGLIVDLKKKVNKKGSIILTFRAGNKSGNKISIYINPKTGQANISNPSSYSASGKIEPYREGDVLIGTTINGD